MRRATSALSAVLLALAFSVLLGGCFFGGDHGPATTETVVPQSEPAPTDASPAPVVLDELSTFKRNAPFKHQALPPTPPTTTTGGSGSTTTTTPGGSGSTTSTTSGGGSTTTSTTNPSGVNTSLHSLKVLSIDIINGTPVVTFEVDDVVYEDKKEGDVVDTTWGQIEVVDIDPEDQVVVFLHGSETRTLSVGQEFLK